MKTSALINVSTNMVENIVVADPMFDKPPSGYLFVAAGAAQIGATYDPATKTIANPPAPPPPAPTVPANVALWQAKAIMAQTPVAGGTGTLLDPVNTWIAASNDVVLQSFWRDAASIDRASPTLAKLAKNFSLTDAQVDQMFVTAAAIRL